jgi:hypothetical protein
MDVSQMKRWPCAKGSATGEETKRPNPKIQTDKTKLVLFLAPTLSETTTQAEIQSALSHDARARFDRGWRGWHG